MSNTTNYAKTLNAITSREGTVAVVGLGYVGLPMAVIIAKAGYNVLGIDTNEEKIALLNKGISYTKDVSPEDLNLVRSAKRFALASEGSGISGARVVLICLPTPLDNHKLPDLSYIVAARDMIAPRIGKGQLVILESSTYPGTTREVLLPALEARGKKAGADFFLAFAPERIDPGNTSYPPEKIPRVVGGITKQCTRLAQKFYESVLSVPVRPMSSPEAAEMTKLLENTYRLVNISFVNEFARLSRKLGLDIWEVIEAAKTKPFGFTAFYPSAKVGGHCAPVDPFYLSWKAREKNFFAHFIELAGEINDAMPSYVVGLVEEALNSRRRSLAGSKILIWGVAYKRDIEDVRESAALAVIPELIGKRARVSYVDPNVSSVVCEGKTLRSLPAGSIVSRVGSFDAVLILTDHSGFDYEEIARKSKLVVDTRNAVKSRSLANVFRI